jgi:hypothetical protein
MTGAAGGLEGPLFVSTRAVRAATKKRNGARFAWRDSGRPNDPSGKPNHDRVGSRRGGAWSCRGGATATV